MITNVELRGKTSNGFDFKFTPWQTTYGENEDGTKFRIYMMFCVVSWNDVEMAKVPCVVTEKDTTSDKWEEGITQLIQNGIDSANDCALHKLGWPPYEKK